MYIKFLVFVLFTSFVNISAPLGSNGIFSPGRSSTAKRIGGVIKVTSKTLNTDIVLNIKQQQPQLSNCLPLHIIPEAPPPPAVMVFPQKTLSKPFEKPKSPARPKQSNASPPPKQTIVLPEPPLPTKKELVSTVIVTEIPPVIATLSLDKLNRRPKHQPEGKVSQRELPPILSSITPPKITSIKTKIDPSILRKLPLYFDDRYECDRLFGEYVVIDTEATGLGNDHEITEIAAVKMRNMQPTGEKFQMYINPGREVSASAHQLTRYTWKSLKRFPSFKEVAHKFLDFIGNLPLIFHNAHYDLKLLNKGLKGIIPYRLEDKHVIIDSYLFAKEVFPMEKNGLTSLAERYNLKRPGNNDTHGALIDADLLCEVFRGLFRANGSRFSDKDIDWSHLPSLSIDSFPPIKGTLGETFFRQLGIRGDLPTTFRYAYNLYHPKLHRNFPAILIPFETSHGQESGMYVRYIIDKPIKTLSTAKNFDQITRSYYGNATTFPIAHIYGEGTDEESALVLGSISACLLFRDQIDSENDTSKYIRSFLGSNIIIKAILDSCFLQNIEVSDNTKIITVLSEEDPMGKEVHKMAYYELINKLCSPQFLPLSKVRETTVLYTGWLVRYNNENWEVDIQETDDDEIRLHIIESKYKKRTANVIITATKIIIDEDISLPHSHSKFLLSPPRKSLMVIPLRCDGDGYIPLTHVIKKNPTHILERSKLRLPIYQPKDLAFYEKVTLAKSLYDKALPITEDTPSARYFEKRGLQESLPECFRYLPKMFHPGQDAEFPLTLVPLSNAEGNIVAIHRLFCDENGTQLPKKSGYPSKLSLGKAAGAFVELYRRSSGEKEPDTLMISEGIENALVIREVLMNLFNKNPKEFDQLLRLLDANSGISIRAVIGVNGLIDAPIESNIKTMIILADNDGENKDVKSTLRKTVEHYLLMDKSVKIVLPTHPDREKTDLNDVYLLESIETRDKVILDIIKQAIKISFVEQLGSDEETLEISLKKLSPLPRINKSKKSDEEIERDLQSLLFDPNFMKKGMQGSRHFQK